MLLAEEGITREILIGFLTYTLSHPRPINEVMSPRWKELDASFQAEFNGMTIVPVGLDELIATRIEMLSALKKYFTARERDFLLSFKSGHPDWSLFVEPSVEALPAVKWKLLNIQKLANNNPVKHQEQFAKLEGVLDLWVAGGSS